MTHLLFLPLLLPAGIPCRSVQQCMGMESPAAYELTITAVMSILPAPLRTFLENNTAEFRHLVVANVEAEMRGQANFGERQWHYVELDIEAPVADRAERRAAVRRFPHDKEKTKELFERHGSLRGGILPWIIEERYESLEHGFRTGNLEQTLRAAAELLHYSADAAMPLQTSGCCFYAVACGDEAMIWAHRGTYHRTLTAFQEVLAFEVRIHPDSVSPSTQPLEDAFATAMQAYDSVEHVLCTYLDCPPDLVELSTAGVDRKCCDQWCGLPTTALPYMKMQLENGALLAANLIVGAWTQAGRPEIKPIPPPAGPSVADAAPIPPPKPVPTAEGALVGSQDSVVYHRATCPHAARIKLENRVSLETSEKAKAAGRTPCKACKPDAN